jgi:hypothetical protein
MAPHIGGVLHDMINQPQEAIHEIVPGAGLVVQTAPDQLTVAGNQSHRMVPRVLVVGQVRQAFPPLF